MSLIVNIPPSTGGGGQQKLSAISAVADSAVSFTDSWTIFDDDLLNQWTTSIAGSGVRNRTTGPSTVQLDSGITGGSAANQIYGLSLTGGGFPLLVPGGAAAKWFLEYRMKVTTAIDAAASAGSGDDTLLMIGIRGSVSITKWAAFFDTGAAIQSTINIDNGTYHRFRAWRDGTTTSFQVDNESPVLSAGSFPSANARFFLRVANGTAASRAAEFDYVFLRGERP